MTTLYDFSAPLLDRTPQPLSTYRDKVVLVVNVASKCGFTRNIRARSALSDLRGSRSDLRGSRPRRARLPCNQFGVQRAGTEAEIAAFCDLDYNVTFPVFSKVTVNGRKSLPLYNWLKRKAPGMLGVQDRLELHQVPRRPYRHAS